MAAMSLLAGWSKTVGRTHGWILAAALFCAACGGGVKQEAPVLTGSMVAVSGSAMDYDVNDTSTTNSDNDSLGSAQELPNPVTVGGYANVASAGAPGQTESAGDPEDWYRVMIAAGQVVRLMIAEGCSAPGVTNDLDVELLELNGVRVLGHPLPPNNQCAEEIQVASTGTYLVKVSAQTGASNYTLTIGQAPSRADEGPAAQPEFVPGQVIVRYERDLQGALSAASAGNRAASLGMRHVAGSGDAPMLFSFAAPAERAAALQSLGMEAPPEARREVYGVSATPAEAEAAAAAEADALAADTRRIVEAMRAQPGVRSADFNYIRRASATPNDEYFPLQWHLDQINLPQAWDLVLPRNDADPDSHVVVGVVDTGVKLAHPDFAGQLVPGYDFIFNDSVSGDGEPGCDTNPDDPGDRAAGGSSYHGTHVAGTVGASTSLQNPTAIDGVASVAWNTKIMPLRVLGIGGGTDFDIMSALRFAAGRDNACGASPVQTAQVINMSLGGPGYNQGFQDLVDELRDEEDMIFVAAAGNASTSAPSYPAAYSGVISVSAVGPTRNRAPYSNYGPSIDVAAPGGDFQQDLNGDGYPDGVLSTLYDENSDEYIYSFYQGTSMAAPHVAGVIALMLTVNPDITPADIDNWLAERPRTMTRDIGAASSFGNGLIDAAMALNKASTSAGGGGAVNAVLHVDPDSLNYGLLATTFELTVSNGGNESQPLVITSVSPVNGAPWLSVAADTVDPSGLGTYDVAVERTGLADGIYTDTLRFSSTENDVDVPVIMQVGDEANARPNAGHHFVVLIDAATDEVVDFLETDAHLGVYDFSFRGMEAGRYVVFAGTDSDNDFFICDPGEACGAFPTTDSAEPVAVSGPRWIQFTTGFAGSFEAAGAGSGAASAQGIPLSRGAKLGR